MVSNIFKLHYLPRVTVGWFLLTFITCYFVSTQNGHVSSYIPFLSDIGTTPPESCIFSQMMAIGVILLSIVIYIRHRQVDFAIKSKNINLNKKWNIISLWSGLVFCGGLSVSSNVQETAALLFHMCAATVAFIGAGIYLISNTKITFAFEPLYRKYSTFNIGKTVVYLRLCLTVLCFIFAPTTSVCVSIMWGTLEEENITWWPADREGYELHLIAATSEWLLAFTLLLYISTWTKEFQTLEYEEICFKTKYVMNDSK